MSIEFDSSIANFLQPRPTTRRERSRSFCSAMPHFAGSATGTRAARVQSFTGMAGDGRCLFRSVIHCAYLRAGKQSPSESLQKQLADELRAKVADEFVKRRAEIERFLEGDFDTYVAEMRQPHKWGGEPELLMCSHILQSPITVFMKERFSGSLKIIAEYGREYGTENSINVLYHSYGHYDALLAPIGNVQSKTSYKR